AKAGGPDYGIVSASLGHSPVCAVVPDCRGHVPGYCFSYPDHHTCFTACYCGAGLRSIMVWHCDDYCLRNGRHYAAGGFEPVCDQGHCPTNIATADYTRGSALCGT